jgi:serine protease Do
MPDMPTYEHMIEYLRPSAVQILDGRGGGSGVVWSDGTVVTNSHVVAGEEATIVDASGSRSRARVVLRDRERDLALLRPLSLPAGRAAAIGDSGALRPGQLVLALGNPLGIAGAVATGIIHSIGRDWIQADVRLAPGNSGGMLADAAGRVIGINTMIFRGLALAVPSNAVGSFVERS